MSIEKRRGVKVEGSSYSTPTQLKVVAARSEPRNKVRLLASSVLVSSICN